VSEPETIDRNEVELVGRVSGDPTRRTLPSGDEVVQLRVVVRRDHQGVDTLDVTCGPAPPAGARRRPGQSGRRLLSSAERLSDGDRVRIVGELRRRWWGSGGHRQSRVEVRAHHLVAATPRRSSAPAGGSEGADRLATTAREG
jgi:single-strand DNA-binding protein